MAYAGSDRVESRYQELKSELEQAEQEFRVNRGKDTRVENARRRYNAYEPLYREYKAGKRDPFGSYQDAVAFERAYKGYDDVRIETQRLVARRPEFQQDAQAQQARAYERADRASDMGKKRALTRAAGLTSKEYDSMNPQARNALRNRFIQRGDVTTTARARAAWAGGEENPRASDIVRASVDGVTYQGTREFVQDKANRAQAKAEQLYIQQRMEYDDKDTALYMLGVRESVPDQKFTAPLTRVNLQTLSGGIDPEVVGQSSTTMNTQERLLFQPVKVRRDTTTIRPGSAAGAFLLSGDSRADTVTIQRETPVFSPSQQAVITATGAINEGWTATDNRVKARLEGKQLFTDAIGRFGELGRVGAQQRYNRQQSVTIQSGLFLDSFQRAVPGGGSPKSFVEVNPMKGFTGTALSTFSGVEAFGKDFRERPLKSTLETGAGAALVLLTKNPQAGVKRRVATNVALTGLGALYGYDVASRYASAEGITGRGRVVGTTAGELFRFSAGAQIASFGITSAQMFKTELILNPNKGFLPPQRIKYVGKSGTVYSTSAGRTVGETARNLGETNIGQSFSSMFKSKSGVVRGGSGRGMKGKATKARGRDPRVSIDKGILTVRGRSKGLKADFVKERRIKIDVLSGERGVMDVGLRSDMPSLKKPNVRRFRYRRSQALAGIGAPFVGDFVITRSTKTTDLWSSRRLYNFKKRDNAVKNAANVLLQEEIARSRATRFFPQIGKGKQATTREPRKSVLNNYLAKNPLPGSTDLRPQVLYSEPQRPRQLPKGFRSWETYRRSKNLFDAAAAERGETIINQLPGVLGERQPASTTTGARSLFKQPTKSFLSPSSLTRPTRESLLGGAGVATLQGAGASLAFGFSPVQTSKMTPSTLTTQSLSFDTGSLFPEPTLKTSSRSPFETRNPYDFRKPQLTTPLFDFTGGRGGGDSSFTPKPPPPPPPPVGFPPLAIPGFGSGTKPRAGKRRAFRYAPSLLGVFSGRKQRTKGITSFGLDIRGL